jgi:hypothetical protein
MGNGGFFRFCVKKTGCRIALSYTGVKKVAGVCGGPKGGMASICDRGFGGFRCEFEGCVVGCCEACDDEWAARCCWCAYEGVGDCWGGYVLSASVMRLNVKMTYLWPRRLQAREHVKLLA